MKTTIKLLIAISIGLPVGFYGRALLHEPPDRVEAALALFEDFCIPIALEGEQPNVGRLAQSGRNSWADPDSKFIIELGPGKCTISDAPLIMSAAERAAFEQAVISMVAQNFPQFDNTDLAITDGWDLISGWFQFEMGDPRRWGVLLARVYEEGPESFTILSVGGSPP